MGLLIDERGIVLDLAFLRRALLHARRNKDPGLLQLRRQREQWRGVIEERAFKSADRISDLLGVRDPLIRRINRLAWYKLDLEQAGDAADCWRAIEGERRRLCGEWRRLNGAQV